MSLVGSLQEYDSEIEGWNQYTERLEQYFIANDIVKPEKRRAVFLTVVGPKAFSLLRDLIAPERPTDKELTALIEILANHFEPKPSEIVERFKFNRRERKSGESIATYLAELRRLARFCAFGSTLDTMLRDRLVCGCNDEVIQKKLLMEPNLTLARACEIATSIELAVKNADSLRSSVSNGDDSDVVQLLKQHRQRWPSDKPQKSQSTSFTEERPEKTAGRTQNSGKSGCFRCGNQTHRADACRFKKVVCHACGKIGHLAAVCRSKPTKPAADAYEGRNVHNMKQRSRQRRATKCYNVYRLGSVLKAPPPVYITCKVNRVPVRLEVDSGAPFSMISKAVYERHKATFHELQPTNFRLKSFTHQPIAVEGVLSVTVNFGSRQAELPLLVTRGNSANLAGRNWFCPLNLTSAFPLSDVQKLSAELSCSETVSNLKQVHLKKKPDAIPKFRQGKQVHRKKPDGIPKFRKGTADANADAPKGVPSSCRRPAVDCRPEAWYGPAASGEARNGFKAPVQRIEDAPSWKWTRSKEDWCITRIRPCFLSRLQRELFLLTPHQLHRLPRGRYRRPPRRLHHRDCRMSRPRHVMKWSMSLPLCPGKVQRIRPPLPGDRREQGVCRDATPLDCCSCF